jgi:release factor glutamine methyltransferase
MNPAELRIKFQNELSGKYPASETDAIFFLLLQHYTGINRTRFFSNNGQPLPDKGLEEMNAALARLLKHEPVQYIIGETEFCGLRIKVNPSVLIPRPETEEMVELIKLQASNLNAQIIDMCSGSGCIAITLKNFFPQSSVTAFELSEEAIRTAKENAALNNTDINFIRGDVFNPPEELQKYKFDLMVSNPPYVLPSEKDSMGANVYDHEPQVAVFVPENKPLMFYDAISNLALKRLKAGGTLWFESDEDRADDVGELVTRKNFSEVKVHTDLSGKKRFISAKTV